MKTPINCVQDVQALGRLQITPGPRSQRLWEAPYSLHLFQHPKAAHLLFVASSDTGNTIQQPKVGCWSQVEDHEAEVGVCDHSGRRFRVGLMAPNNLYIDLSPTSRERRGRTVQTAGFGGFGDGKCVEVAAEFDFRGLRMKLSNYPCTSLSPKILLFRSFLGFYFSYFFIFSSCTVYKQ